MYLRDFALGLYSFIACSLMIVSLQIIIAKLSILQIISMSYDNSMDGYRTELR